MYAQVLIAVSGPLFTTVTVNTTLSPTVTLVTSGSIVSAKSTSEETKVEFLPMLFSLFGS